MTDRTTDDETMTTEGGKRMRKTDDKTGMTVDDEIKRMIDRTIDDETMTTTTRGLIEEGIDSTDFEKKMRRTRDDSLLNDRGLRIKRTRGIEGKEITKTTDDEKTKMIDDERTKRELEDRKTHRMRD